MISPYKLLDHGLVHDIYGTLEEIFQSELGIAIKEACKKLACIQGNTKLSIVLIHQNLHNQ